MDHQTLHMPRPSDALASSNSSFFDDSPTSPVDCQPRTYTTAGTLYNPETAGSFPIPIRRGRNNRWPPNHPSDLAGLPKGILATLPLHMHRTRSPTTTASSFKHYSPLRQNNDRAVTPPTKEDRPCEPPGFGLRTTNIQSAGPVSSNAAYTLSSDRVSPSEHKFTMVSPVASSTSKSNFDHLFADVPTSESKSSLDDVEVKKLTTDEDQEDENEAALADSLAAQLNFKALTSLASYENPSQKLAKRALARGRAALLTPTPLSSAVSAPPGFTHLPRRNTFTTGPAQTTNPGIFGNELNRRSGLLQGAPSHGSNFVASVANPSNTSTLSTGPGAPRPLTAGPPGLRQYRSTLEASTQPFRSSSTPPDENPKFGPIEPPKTSKENFGYPKTHPALKAHEPASRQPIVRPTPMVSDSDLWKDKDGAKKIVPKHSIIEREPFHKIVRYYPNGMPNNYSVNTKDMPASDDWEESLMAARRGLGPMNAAQVARYQKKVEDFWQGNSSSRLWQSMEEIIADRDKRHLLRILNRSEGIDTTDSGHSTSTKPTPPPLSLRQCLDMDRCKHSEPLLNMAYGTLLGCIDQDGPGSWYSMFEAPAPWVLDNSEAGRKSFFASKRRA